MAKKGGSADSVYKVVELVGTSSKSWEDAAKNAVETAAGSLRDLRVAEIVKQLCAFEHRSARCANNFLVERQRLEIWRPRRLLSRNPERADHNHRQ